MIDNEQVCGLCRRPGSVEWAGTASAPKACFGCAAIVLRGQPPPDIAFRISIQVEGAAVAVRISELPDQHFRENTKLHLVPRWKTACTFQAPGAKIIGPPLEYCSMKTQPQGRGQIGNVLPNELVLKIDRVR